MSFLLTRPDEFNVVESYPDIQRPLTGHHTGAAVGFVEKFLALVSE